MSKISGFVCCMLGHKWIYIIGECKFHHMQISDGGRNASTGFTTKFSKRCKRCGLRKEGVE